MRVQRLGELAHINSGSTPSRASPSYFEGSTPWAKIQDLTDSGMYLYDTAEHVSEVALRTSRLRVFPVGTVLLSMYGSIGTTRVAGVPVTSNQAILGIQCGPDLEPAYLYFYLSMKQQELALLGRGGTQANINASIVGDLMIPIPSRGEQARIAGRLENQLAEANRVLHPLLRSVPASFALRTALVEENLGRFGAEAWERPQLETLLRAPLRTGISGPETDGGGSVGLSIAAVRNGHLDLTKTKRIAVDTSTDRLVRKGRFYIVRGNGRLDLVARAGLAPSSSSEVVFPDLLIEADLNADRVETRFFQLIWDSIDVRGQIEARSSTSSGIHKINLRNLASVEVPLPSIADQRRIIEALDIQLGRSDAASKAIAAQRSAASALPAALIRRAFAAIPA